MAYIEHELYMAYIEHLSTLTSTSVLLPFPTFFSPSFSRREPLWINGAG